jgi:hypothetical protein
MNKSMAKVSSLTYRVRARVHAEIASALPLRRHAARSASAERSTPSLFTARNLLSQSTHAQKSCTRTEAHIYASMWSAQQHDNRNTHVGERHSSGRCRAAAGEQCQPSLPCTHRRVFQTKITDHQVHKQAQRKAYSQPDVRRLQMRCPRCDSGEVWFDD